MNLQETIDRSPMSAFQIRVVALCLLVNMADGYDVLVMAFTSIGVAAEWQLSGSALGTLLSAGLVGMAIGSLFIAPLADRIGRRRLTLGCILLVTAALLASAFAANFAQLAIFRAVTGLGIGGMLASISVIVSEFCPARRRTTAIALFASGFPLGGLVGGAAAAVLISHYGWRSAFLLGALLTGLLAVAVYRSIPESIDFLLARRQPNALEKVNNVLGRMKLPALESLPEAATAGRRVGITTLLRGANATRTIGFCIAFALLLAGYYFVSTWTPKLLLTSGLSPTASLSGGVLINLGGFIGCVVFSLLAFRLKTHLLTTVFVALGAVLLVLFAISVGNLVPALVLSTLLGFTLIGAISGFYATVPVKYDAAVRTTAMGLVIGCGRIGSIVAPLVVGGLLDAGWAVARVYFLFVVPVVLCAVIFSMVADPARGKVAPAVLQEQQGV